MRKAFILFFILCGMLAGCKSSKNIQESNESPLKRKAIVEVEETKLNEEANIIEAKMQCETGNKEKAYRLFNQILHSNPNCDAAHYEIGRMMHEEGAFDSALIHTQAAINVNPKNIWYQKFLAELYENTQNEKKLTDTWETIVKLDPENIEHYYDLSNAYLMTNNPGKAIDALNRVEKRIGVTEEVSLQKQKIWNAMGKEDKALEEVAILAQAMPNEMKYSAIMAECYMKKKDYAHAKIYYDQILKSHPDDEYIHISMANYYKLTGAPDKAYNELIQGFANPKLDCSSKLQILASFYTTEEFYKTYAPKTFHLLDTLANHCEDSSEYALFYGDVLMRQEKYAEAYTWFKYYLNVKTGEYEVWEAMLICENMMKGQEEQLVKDAKKASELFPLHILPYFLQGAAAYEKKEYAEAIKFLEKCEKIGFDNGYLESETYAILSDCYYRNQQFDKAWRCFEQYVAKHPDDMGMLNNYAYYLSECNLNLGKAESMSRKTIDAEPDNATFLDTYAWILHQMGNDKKALPYIEKALKLQKNDSSTLQEHYNIILKGQ